MKQNIVSSLSSLLFNLMVYGLWFMARGFVLFISLLCITEGNLLVQQVNDATNLTKRAHYIYNLLVTLFFSFFIMFSIFLLNLS